MFIYLCQLYLLWDLMLYGPDLFALFYLFKCVGSLGHIIWTPPQLLYRGCALAINQGFVSVEH